MAVDAHRFSIKKRPFYFIGIILAFFIFFLPIFNFSMDYQVRSNGDIVKGEESHKNTSKEVNFEKEFDFGMVWEGTLVEHIFYINNAFSEVLQIQSVVPACGCTSVVVDNPIVQPGGVGAIKVTFNSLNRVGIVAKSILVHTSAKSDNIISFVLKGEVKPIVRIDPRFVSLGVINVGEDPKITISVTLDEYSTKDAKELKITQVESLSDFIQFQVENDRLNHWQIHATLRTKDLVSFLQEIPDGQKNDLPVDAIPFQSIIRIHTNLDLPNMKILFVRVSGMINITQEN